MGSCCFFQNSALYKFIEPTINEMAIMNSAIKYLVVSLILCPVFFSCTQQKLIDGSGVLKGKISIGPICPVETIPPDPKCLPTLDTYKAWAIAVWSPDKKTKVATLSPNLEGDYHIDLPVGDYTIDFDVARTNRVGGSNLPKAISVALGDTTNLDISIDTGIR